MATVTVSNLDSGVFVELHGPVNTIVATQQDIRMIIRLLVKRANFMTIENNFFQRFLDSKFQISVVFEDLLFCDAPTE